MIDKIINIINEYLNTSYKEDEINSIYKELSEVLQYAYNPYSSVNNTSTYEETQDILANLNEKESVRKNKGVYYTPSDVVNFIFINSLNLLFDFLPSDKLSNTSSPDISYEELCFKKTVYDPTCGTGVFLLAALNFKFDLIDKQAKHITIENIKKIVSTIKGNDINHVSTTIAKVRLFLCVLHRYGVGKITGISNILNRNFENIDYVIENKTVNEEFDLIIGNPPYVENSKSESRPEKKYGNIYANVLENASLQLKNNGVIGFIIPLSYIATPRMKNIRNLLGSIIPIQYILSYSDRPDCLFSTVHQKLCILIGKKADKDYCVYTSNYNYWYKEERNSLFSNTQIVENTYLHDGFIPKLGTPLDISIFKKITSNDICIGELLNEGPVTLHMNMRAAFWIKAFLKKHAGSEYKTFKCDNTDTANLCMCLLNSSLFWWFWVCVSDCWHITKKELNGFKLPSVDDYSETNRLSCLLENKLEETKHFIGSKQTEYEYKHKDCVDVIHEIDDYVNNLYGLTIDEGDYIKNYAYRYRVSGGAINENN